MESTNERREHARVPATVRIVIYPSGNDKDPIVDTTTESLDISKGGLLFNSDTSLETDTGVVVKLLLEESLTMNANWPHIEKTFPEGIKLPASVVRCSGAKEIGYQIGMAFHEAEKAKLVVLEEFLREVKEA